MEEKIMNNYEAKIKDLFGNEAFLEKFNAVEDHEKLGDVFKEFGVELTEEELSDLIKTSLNHAQLSADDLENVSGGGVIGVLTGVLKFTWDCAVDHYGSPKKAVREIGLFWARKLGYKG